MVVARKTPIVPALPVSRTTSSQPLPRAVKPKIIPIKKIKKQDPWAVPSLWRYFLLFFVIYALTTQFDSTLLRSIKTYEKTALRPRITSQFNKHVLPTYNNRLHPHIQHIYLRAEPHLDTARVYADSAYHYAKPHAITAYTRLVPYLLKARQSAEAAATTLLTAAGDLRRMYVDPHVKSVWEKIAERETGVVKDDVAFVTETGTNDAVSVTVNRDVASVTETETNDAVSVTVNRDVASVTETETNDAVSVTVDRDVASVTETETNDVAATLVQSSPITHTVNPSSAPSTTQPPDTNTLDTEIDDFLKQLGLQEPIPSFSPSSTTPSPTSSLDDLADASSAAQASTAAKRGDITMRHERWQEELDRAVANVGRRVRSVLKGMREASVRELGDKYRGKTDGERGNGIVWDMQTEARRLVRGLEKVRGVAEEKEMWDMVLGKVQEKFQKELIHVQSKVHEWYVGVREREVGEIQRAAAEVRSLAEKAQADIGFDYAWLEDVTYADWQRYHDLMRTSEQFTILVQKLQNGTLSESEFPDPLVDALDELERELDGVVSGFMVVLEAVGKKGAGVMNEHEDGGVSILPIEPEPVGVDVSDVLVGRSREEVEERLSEERIREEL